jgi:8-oxo-dGTP diphosphatase
MRRLIHVAAGALLAADARVLVAKRADKAHQGGLWEFPGGKLEPGESVGDALQRELFEELGVRVARSEPLIRVRHDYADRAVLLDVHKVLAYRGEAQAREGQPLRWLLPGEMNAAEFPAADRPIINALRLPDRMLITGVDGRYPEQFLARLQRALEQGLRLVQMRAPELPSGLFFELAKAAQTLCEQYSATLLLNPPQGSWKPLPEGVGLHLNRWRLMGMETRPLSENRLLGASCHSLQELQKAQDLDLDYVLLSPVQTSASHPDAEPLGWRRFAEWVDNARMPVFALGGMAESDLMRAKLAGAQGIAAISAWWPTASRAPSQP